MNASLLTAIAVCGVATSQEVAWTTSGVPFRQIGAWWTTCIGDVNQDGYEEILAGVHGWCGGGPGPGGGTGGYLWLLSGRDGSLIREIAQSTTSYSYGFDRVAAAGDWNADGIPDYAVGIIPTNRTEIRSGSDDSVLLSLSGVWPYMAGNLDLDGDGRKDFLVMTWAVQGGMYGRARAYDHSGALLYELQGDWRLTADPALAFNSLAGLNDVDGDGCDDWALGAFEPSRRGVVMVVSGRTGRFLRACYGERKHDNIGYELAACGDLDGDGCTDFVATNGGTSFVPRGVARAFSSRTGQVLEQWVQPGSFGKHVSSRGVDLDGDRVPDVVVGYPDAVPVANNVTGAAMAFSGRDGSPLFTLQQAPAGVLRSRFGYFFSLARPPIGGHGGSVVLTDSYGNHHSTATCWHDLGSISLIRGTPRTATMLGPACPGNLTAAPDLGMQSIVGGVRVHLTRVPPAVPAVLLLGLSTTSHAGVPLPASLDPFGLPGCLLRTSIDTSYLVMTSSLAHPPGYTSIDLPHPVPATGQGTWSVSAQWLVLGDAQSFPGGVSQAIRWRQ